MPPVTGDLPASLVATKDLALIPPVKRRKVEEGSCYICYLPFEPEEDVAEYDALVTWCQGSCGQNVHSECIETWIAGAHGGNVRKIKDIKCPFCRQPWKGELRYTNIYGRDMRYGETDHPENVYEEPLLGVVHVDLVVVELIHRAELTLRGRLGQGTIWGMIVFSTADTDEEYALFISLAGEELPEGTVIEDLAFQGILFRTALDEWLFWWQLVPGQAREPVREPFRAPSVLVLLPHSEVGFSMQEFLATPELATMPVDISFQGEEYSGAMTLRGTVGHRRVWAKIVVENMSGNRIEGYPGLVGDNLSEMLMNEHRRARGRLYKRNHELQRYMLVDFTFTCRREPVAILEQ